MKTATASFFILFFIHLPISAYFIFYADFSPLAAAEINYEADVILVKFKGDSRATAVNLAPNENYEQQLDYYKNLSSVEYAEPDYIYSASIIPSDPYFNSQWYLKKIKAAEAWNETRESPSVVIAILDSGVQISHPDLRSNIWVNKKEIAGNNTDDDKNGFIDDLNGWDFINNTPDPAPKFMPGFTEDGIYHGTIIAGIAAAAGNNAAGVSGVTWKAKIMPLKVLDDKGEGSASRVIKAIDYAVDNGADIINLSFVGFGYSRGLDDAIKRAYDAKIIVVAAGGNEVGEEDGYNLDLTPMYPACLDGPNGENRVIGVAATDTMDQKTSFSSYGLKCIDIAAPGVSAFSTVVYSPNNYIGDLPFNKYYDGYWSGTSVSVPIISGALALIEGANPSLNRDQAVAALLNNADNISRVNPNYLGQLGRGRVNVESSVKFARGILKNKSEKLLIGPQSGMSSLTKITDQNGLSGNEFYAYAENFKGGESFASGDTDGDGQAEIITAAGPGGGPHVRIFNLKGELAGQFFAFNDDFRGGVNIASADVNGDGQDEIIAVQAGGGNSEIKIFNGRGVMLGSFYAYDSKFSGGLNIAAGDIDGDGQAEIVTGLAAGRIPEVRIFKAIGVMQGVFLAYPKDFRGGVRLTIAKARNGTSGKAEIITAPEKGGGPHVKFFDHHANLISHFFAFNEKFHGGVNLSKADVNGDGLDEIIAGAGPGAGPHVRVFTAEGKIVGSFYAYGENFSGGVSVGSLVINK